MKRFLAGLIERIQMDLFELTAKLIDIPSVSGAEAEVGHFLAAYLEDLDYHVEKQEVTPNRFNVLATTSASPRIVFSTHLDTVPPHISARVDAERIHGRGACDAKGIIAAQIVAAENLRKQGINQIGLLFTVDEELGSLGAQVANRHPLAAECRYLINGEPTDNRLASGTKGSLRLTIKTEGRAAHSAYPEQGSSAIEKLLSLLGRITNLDWPSDDLLGDTTCNIGVIAGGTRPNVVPSEANAELQIRLVTGAETIKQMLETTIDSRAHLEYSSAHDPVRLMVLDGFDECVVRFTTDIPYLSRWGKPLLLGPGSILNAHTDHECVEKRELEEAVDLYVRMARTLTDRI